MELQILEEPELEFGERLRHVDPRTGIRDFGPADLDSTTRPTVINVGLVGELGDVRELRAWLERCARGLAGKETHQGNLFPSFPGCDAEASFRTSLHFDRDLSRELTKRRVQALTNLSGPAAVKAAVDLIVGEVQVLLEKTRADVVIVVRPEWLDDDGGEDNEEDEPTVVGFNFRDVLKARSMHLVVRL